jgi:hypothetical protein
VFNTHFSSNRHHSKVASISSVVDCSRISVSAARGSLRPGKMHSVDRAIIAFYSCSIDIYRLLSTVLTFKILFLLSVMAECQFRSMWGVETENEVTIRNSRPQLCPGGPLKKFRLSLTIISYSRPLSWLKIWLALGAKIGVLDL